MKYRRFYWQRGSGAFSLGRSQLEAVVKDASEQERHHRQVSFQEEFRRVLAKYGVEFDERSVWD